MRKRILLLFFSITFIFSSFGLTVFAEETLLVPVGKSIGVTLSCDGVMVVSVDNVKTKDGKSSSPAQLAGIKPGDIIKSFNGTTVHNVDELLAAVSVAQGKKSTINFCREGKNIEALLTPLISAEDEKYKIGVWIKDAASGIGTMTYYSPETKTFGALGHGICNPDTGNIIPLSNGNILSSVIVDVKKGSRGSPGELKGVFAEDGTLLGNVKKNTSHGIFGTLENPEEIISTSALPVADKKHISPGKAYILSNIEGSTVEKFEAEILRVMSRNTTSSKDMIIKITDKKLIDKTGGIVQGMSGSPILQNGRIVGAVTHVFVNDPTRGYGIFIENMLAEAEKIK